MLDDLEPLDDGPSLRGRFVALLRRRPADSFGLALMFAMVMTTLANALFLQSGKHPAPMRAISAIAQPTPETTGSLMMPRPRPAAAAIPAPDLAPAARSQAEVIADIQKELARRGFYGGALDGLYGPRMEAAIHDFERAYGLKPGAVPDENFLVLLVQAPAKPGKPAATKKPQPAGQRQEHASLEATPARVLAVQRALADFGYGQINTTGAFDDATRSAVEKFERERKLPVSGKLSERLLRELAAVTGRVLD